MEREITYNLQQWKAFTQALARLLPIVWGICLSVPLRAQVEGICIGYDEETMRRIAEQLDAIGPVSTTSNSSFITSQPSSRLVSHETDVRVVGGTDDALLDMGPSKQREAERQKKRDEEKSYLEQYGVDPHAEAFANTMYPSAATCAKCHKKIYDEWRVSAHAYAGVSPMFQRFEQAVADITRGTVGSFCMRCHEPVATQLKLPREASILEGAIVLREGVTCIACHRVVERYGRVNGERRIEPGGVYDPVVGYLGGDGVNEAIAKADNFKVRTSPLDKSPGQDIHRGAIQFEQLSDSSFCASCHQVVVQPGIALEIVYQQYRAGPACKKGISCQDCHMGAIPGKPLGYETGAAAEMSGKVVRQDRKHANHMFHGPSYPISHPGLFPHNDKALRWKATDLVAFDWRAGWGTEQFEQYAKQNGLQVGFPEVWKNQQERRDARKVIDENLLLINTKMHNASATLSLSSELKGPLFKVEPAIGQPLHFDYIVCNTSEGHNMPSGSLGAQPQLWLNIVLIGPNGQRLFESGDLDRYGDLRDVQSLEVQQRTLPPDLQLTNFQTKFLVTNVKGTEREFFFPIPVDVDPLPFFRPGVVPYTVLNHPPLARMEAHSIPPLDHRVAKYFVPSELLMQPGVYRLSARLRSRVEPPYFARLVGLPDEAMRLLNERIVDFHGQSFEFVVR